MIYIYAIILLFAFCYYGLILIFSFAFLIKKTEKIQPQIIEEKISIIIAFRNEENNLYSLINSLLEQKFVNNFEIILINDHSLDKSEEIISDFIKKTDRIKLYNLPDTLYGKKQSLRFGAKKAEGNVLMFSDADCILQENWITIMYNYMKINDLQMACGPVEFLKRKGFLNNFFQTEFLSMIGSGAAGFFLRKPFICNGANYAIEKKIFDEASNFFNDKYSSGDDVFLLHYVSKFYNVGFVKSKEVIVQTQSPNNISQFFSQRIRWASKTSGYKNFMTLFTLCVNVSFSIIIILISLLSIFSVIDYKFLIIIFLLKIIIDCFFMFPILKFHKKLYLLINVPIIQIFYPFYLIITGLLSVFYRPKWKGRQI